MKSTLYEPINDNNSEEQHSHVGTAQTHADDLLKQHLLQLLQETERDKRVASFFNKQLNNS